LAVLNDDPVLGHYENDLKARIDLTNSWLKTFQEAEGGLLSIARSYKKYGLNL